MSKRTFALTCALGAAAALTVGGATEAGAQQTTTTRDSASVTTSTTTTGTSTRAARSTRRIPVSKDRGDMTSATSSGMRSSITATDSAVGTTPAPVAATPAPVDTTSAVSVTTTPSTTTASDTTTVTMTATPVATTTESPGTMTGRFGNGFYIGLGGGASLPQGTFNDWYKSGWNINVPFGWQSPNNPLGVRFDVGYNRLSGRDFDFGVLGSGSTRDPQIWSGLVDLKLDLPLGTSEWRPKLYALGGGGVHYFRNFTSEFNQTAGTAGGTAFQTQLDGSSQTKFGLNGGGGFSFGVGRADLFIEARYTSVFTSGKNTNYVPVVAGITFF